MTRTILVVDDIAANRNLLGATLEPRGYEVLLASNGSAALKVAARSKPNLILMDVNMPEMDGYEACRQLKGMPELADIPVIFITANDDPQSLVKGFQAGGVDYITKPFKEEEVLMRVETHVKIHTLSRALESGNQALAAKNAELEAEVLRRKQAEDIANEANEAKSRFLAFISHEMRSPLTTIICFSDEIAKALIDDRFIESRGDAGRIRGAGAHLLEMINNLLDLSRIEAGKMPLNVQDVDLRPLLTELGKDLAPLVSANGNTWTLEPDGDIGTVQTDATKLKQVLTNLISNGGKFTRNGAITVSMRHLPGTDVPRFEVSVTDTGIGMTEAQIERLFQAYQQATDATSSKYGGTGLGLTISRQFCRLMGGDLTVTSEAGKGSAFTVTLPMRVVETPSGAQQPVGP